MTTTFKAGFLTEKVQPIVDRLPKPTGGSEKQNAWAEQLQYEGLMTMVERLAGREDSPQVDEYLTKVEKLVALQVSAKWWIDHRGMSAQDLAKALGW